MPFFLFCDTLMMGSAGLIWMARDPLSAVPFFDGGIAIFVGLHALLLLLALSKRGKLEFVWFSPREMTTALALGLATLALSRAWAAAPAFAGVTGWEFGAPSAIAHVRHVSLPLYPPTSVPWIYGGAEVSEALLSVYALGMIGPWAIGGFGLAALCFGMLTLELERPGARRLAVFVGALGYAFLFLGEPLAVAQASPGRSPILIAGAQMAERFFIGAAAGHIFLATRHLLGAGLLLGMSEWTSRYLLDEAASTRFAPLFLAKAPDQVHYWTTRLLCAALALGVVVLATRRKIDDAAAETSA
jgi:hypothetical protein